MAEAVNFEPAPEPSCLRNDLGYLSLVIPPREVTLSSEGAITLPGKTYNVQLASGEKLDTFIQLVSDYTETMRKSLDTPLKAQLRSNTVQLIKHYHQMVKLLKEKDGSGNEEVLNFMKDLLFDFFAYQTR